jgi:hypothetical protein
MKRRGDLKSTFGIIGIPDPLSAFDTPALHFQDQTAFRMQKHEIRFYIGASTLSRDVQGMDQHIVVRQLTAEALEETSLGLHIKPLRYRIGDAKGHSPRNVLPETLKQGLGLRRKIRHTSRR